MGLGGVIQGERGTDMTKNLEAPTKSLTGSNANFLKKLIRGIEVE